MRSRNSTRTSEASRRSLRPFLPPRRLPADPLFSPSFLLLSITRCLPTGDIGCLCDRSKLYVDIRRTLGFDASGRSRRVSLVSDFLLLFLSGYEHGNVPCFSLYGFEVSLSRFLATRLQTFTDFVLSRPSASTHLESEQRRSLSFSPTSKFDR